MVATTATYGMLLHVKNLEDTELSLSFDVTYDSPADVPTLSRASIWTMLALQVTTLGAVWAPRIAIFVMILY